MGNERKKERNKQRKQERILACAKAKWTKTKQTWQREKKYFEKDFFFAFCYIEKNVTIQRPYKILAYIKLLIN